MGGQAYESLEGPEHEHTCHQSQQYIAGAPGYERPGPLSVYQVTGGGPRSDGGRIYLPPIRGDEELLCLAHEYVHLAFRHHPATRNEDFVERTARALLLGEELQ